MIFKKLFKSKSAKNYDKKLSKEEWGNLYNDSMLESLVNSINNDNLSSQTKEILKIVEKNQKTLEIGCGTGQSSLCLARKGVIATALDYEQRCLDLVKKASEKLNISIETALCNAFVETPFEINSFDYIFHSGLLEHFTKEERINFLRLWKPYCKKMISMVPNAASIAYRTGKEIMEKEGTWQYGIEMPLYTQIPDFIEAGYNVLDEYTIGAENALNFLSDKNPLKRVLKDWINNSITEDDCHQGYLLVTIGEANNITEIYND